MKLRIANTLYCGPVSEIELPISSWEEIKDWFVKWDTLHYTLDGKVWNEEELNSLTDEIIDWKRPISTDIYDLNTDELLAEN
jgi:hypothetical protein